VWVAVVVGAKARGWHDQAMVTICNGALGRGRMKLPSHQQKPCGLTAVGILRLRFALGEEVRAA